MTVFTFQPGRNSDADTCLNTTGCACSATVRAVSGLAGSELPTPDAYSQAGVKEASPASTASEQLQPSQQP